MEKSLLQLTTLSQLFRSTLSKINLKNAAFTAVFFLWGLLSNAATITSTATGGTWSTGSSWVGGVVPGTTDSVIIVNGATITLSAARTVANVTIDVGGKLNIANINALTVTGNLVNNGTFTGTSGRLYMTGTTMSFNNAGTFTMGAGRVYFYGNVTAFGTHTLTSTEVRFYGTTTQSIPGFITTGLVSMRKTGGVATFTGNVKGAGLTINGSGGTLNLGAGLTHTFTGNVTLSAGSLNGGSSILNENSVSTAAWGGTGSVFTAGTGTVVFGAAGNQTLSASATTFNNVIFGNSGIKTLTTTKCTINNVASMEGTATVSAVPTYGAAATLQYNTATARTAGVEWLTPFAATGGILINNTGAITMNAAKVTNASVPVTINGGATLATNNLQLTFGGNFVNSGTFTAGSSPIVIASTMATQSIAGFTTTGLVTMTKTSGTATLGGTVNSNGFTISGSGGTLNLGTALTHTSTGVITLTAGTLNGGSSTLNVNAISATAWNGTGSVFSAGTGTVNFGAAGAQTLSATATTFNNLIFSNTGVKTLTTANCTANATVSMEGTATVSAAPTYGANAKLQYNTATARTAGVEWITPFAALGGVSIINTGAITMNAAKVFNASVPLAIASGATLTTGNFQLNFGGNFTNAGTMNAGSAPVVIENTMTTQSVAGFTTTGLVSMTKTAGTATFTGNVSGSGLTINGTGGTLHLGAALTHNFSGNWTRTAGTLNGGSSTLRFTGAISGTGGTFTPATGAIDYSGAAQSVVVLPYYNLVLSGSNTKTFAGATTIANALSIASGVVANLGTGFIHTTVGLTLANTNQIIGSWGGTGSGATNINTTYFAAATGKINNNCVNPAITVQPTTPAATCAGSGVQSMNVTATGSGLTYSWRKGGVAVTNGGAISGQGTATLTLTGPATTDAGTYDVIVGGTCSGTVNSNAVTVTVNATPTITTQPSAQSICQTGSGTLLVATSASGPTYQWQYSTNPVTTWTNTNALTGVSGHTTATLSFTNTPLTYNNTNFRCVVTGTNSCSTNSNAALVTVYVKPAVGAVSASQAICSGSLPDDISIASSTGTVQWQKADNAAFTVNLANIGSHSNTLTDVEIGPLTSTTYFRAVASSGVCTTAISSTVTVTIASTTWTSAGGGSWSNGLPNSTKAAIISANYTSTTDISACSLVVNNNAVVVISSGDNIDLEGAITVTSGSFTLSNNANLVQSSDVANSGNIIVKRNTPTLKRQDYELWSSPVTGQQLQSFSPNTLSNRFYTYSPTTNLYIAVGSPATTTFTSGNGYLIRLPNNHPATPTVWTGTFTGVPFNGPLSVNVTNGTYNAIGNPYPCAIDADAFIDDNNITEALYFWRKTNNTVTTSYATYTTAGGVSNSGGDPLGLTPNGVIQVGQGFIAKATSTTFDFSNTQRIEDNSDQFMRHSGNERHRIWLNMTNDADYFCQLLVAYMPDATTGVDAAIDGRYFNDCETALTSLINGEEFTIQGRPLPFDANDVVPLGFKSANAGNFTIALNQVDGLFEEGQAVFLKDNLTGVTQDLGTGAYSFATEAGVFNDRFELRYQNTLAANQAVFSENSVVVYKKGQELVVNSGHTLMAKIEVFDMTGRLVAQKEGIHANEARMQLPPANGLMIVRITSEQQTVVNRKFVN